MSAEPAAIPDLHRDSWPPPLRPALARVVGDAALGLTYRLVQARSRDPFTRGGDRSLSRLYYTADDGWQAPIFHLPAAPGTAGEPVLLTHGLGGSARDFALEPARSLADAMSAAGFSVYLLEHRGDRSALPPAGAPAFSVDDIALRDIPAAIDAIRAHSGYARVLGVGHALGAQALYLALAHLGTDDFAGLVAISAAVRFRASASATRNAGLVAALLPSGWVLPARRLQQLASPFVASGEEIASPDTTGPVARARLRHAAGDLHGGVLRQVARWIHAGHLTDATGRLDVVAALRPFPSVIVTADADPVCSPVDALPAAAALGAELLTLTGGWGHLDPLIGVRAPEQVHGTVLSFLDTQRSRCWG